MKVASKNDVYSKKIWNKPTLMSLNIKNTLSGTAKDNTEDYASGTINTQPNS
jgi:hypothetical protein